jgi:ABC-type sugar transport system permease subunit
VVGYAFVLPLLAFFCLYRVYPILRAFWLSFTNYKYLMPAGTRFVGLSNYIEAVQDKYFRQGLLLGLRYVLIYVPLAIILSLILATLIDRIDNPFVVGAYRVILYLPVILPGAVVYILWKFMYMPNAGLINSFLVDVLHLVRERPQWLASSKTALTSIAIMEVWWYLGYNVLLFLIGLSSINRELYEAARIDGASEVRIFWHITLPLLKPIVLVQMVLKMRIFSIVTPMLIVAGPGQSTWTWGWYAYNLAFVEGNLRMGYASAVGHLGALLMTGLVYLQYRIFRFERVD